MNPMDLINQIKASLQTMQENNADVKDEVLALRAQLLDLAQRGAGVPQGGRSGGDEFVALAIAEAKDGLAAMAAQRTNMCSLTLPMSWLPKAALINPAPGVADPLRQPDRSRGIVASPEQRLLVQSLFEHVPNSTGVVDVVQEATFANNAAIQGNDASPTGSGEGALKPESTVTFTHETKSINVTAHTFVASRQILSDAPLLQSHLDGRGRYGCALAVENQMLTGSGTGLSMEGINTAATAFTGGVTNQTALDAIARGISQLNASNFECTGIVLHPTNWMDIKLLKDSQGRYLIADPQSMASPQLWGVPVVPTLSQTIGRFTVIDAPKFGYVADREDLTIRIGEPNDQFLRNLVTLLFEVRTLLVVERETAAVYGLLATPG